MLSITMSAPDNGDLPDRRPLWRRWLRELLLITALAIMALTRAGIRVHGVRERAATAHPDFRSIILFVGTNAAIGQAIAAFVFGAAVVAGGAGGRRRRLRAPCTARPSLVGGRRPRRGSGPPPTSIAPQAGPEGLQFVCEGPRYINTAGRRSARRRPPGRFRSVAPGSTPRRHPLVNRR